MADKTLKVVVLGDIEDARRKLNSLAGEADTFRGKMAAVGSKMTSIGRGLTTSVTLPIVAGLGVATKAAMEQEKANAQMQATFDSMGAAAWTSVEALQGTASSLQGVTAFGDESIQGLQSLLLTFGNVKNVVGEGNDVFNQATQLGLDMAQALGQDPQQSAIQLGKALNDPIRGVTALQRVGVSFTQQQKDQIKTLVESGDTLGAQKIILAELEKQFGGSAAAFAQTGEGQMKQAMNAMGDAAEQLGAVIIPVLRDVALFVKDVAARFQELSPGTKKMIVIVGVLAAALGPLLLVLGGIATAVSAISLPVLAVVAGIGLLVGAVVLAYNKSETFREAVDKLKTLFTDKLLPVLRELWERALPFIKKALEIVGNVLGWLLTKWIEYVSWIVEGVTTVLGWIKQFIDAFKRGKDVIDNLGFFGALKESFRAAINWIIEKWNNFELKLGGGSILGFDIPEVTLRTPNIPKFHEGGVFRSERPGGEGLALLRDGERVLPVGAGMGDVNVYVQSQADAWAIADAVSWRMRTQGV